MHDSVTATVLWYLSWPVMVIFAYFLVRFALRFVEKKAGKSNTNE
jgi:heme/copper-type cytochrome/quinol oxidase subunit 2